MTRPSHQPVRIALVGCGAIARSVHLPTLAGLPGVRVAALVDPSGDALRAAATVAPAATRVSSLSTLLSSATGDDAVDAVVVCTPTPVLAASAISAFEAGLHVYVEKPVATHADDATALHAAWRASGRLGIAGFNYRQHPLMQQARRLLHDGAIGELVCAQGLFTSRPATLPAWKQDPAAGGALFDRASHHIDLLSWLTGDAPTEARTSVSDRRATGDTAVLACRFGSGVELHGLYSHDAVTDDHLTLVGTLGRMSIDRLSGLGVEVTRGPHDRSVPRRLHRTVRLLSGDAFARLRLLRPAAEPSFRLALTGFVQAVRAAPSTPDHDTGALPTIADAMRCLSVLLAARASVDSGRWETVRPLVTDTP